MKKLFNAVDLPLEKLNSDIDADETILPEVKGKLKFLKGRILNFAIQEMQNSPRLEDLLKELKQITDRVLNPASHHTSIPYYSAEINDAIIKVSELRDITLQT